MPIYYPPSGSQYVPPANPPSAAWTEIAAQTVATPVAAVDFLNVPQGYSVLRLVITDITHDAGTTQTILLCSSGDNGASFTVSGDSATAIGTFTNPSTGSAIIDIAEYTQTNAIKPTTSYYRRANTPGGLVTCLYAAGAINALRIKTGSAGNIAAGTLRLYGR